MTSLPAVAIGIVVGAGAGYAAGRLPVAPVFRSIAATMIGWLVASIVTGTVWLARPPAGLGAAAVAIGVGTGEIVFLVGAIAGVAVLHVALAWLAPAVANYRATIFAWLGAAYGAIKVARLLALAYS